MLDECLRDKDGEYKTGFAENLDVLRLHLDFAPADCLARGRARVRTVVLDSSVHENP